MSGGARDMKKGAGSLWNALARGDATVIGVGQGKQSARWAFPRQMEAAQAVHQLTRPHLVMRAVDSDGERSVVIVPKIPRGHATELGARFGQRSILDGKTEVASVSEKELTQFGDAEVRTFPRGPFWTYIPEKRLYYTLVPVSPHVRRGRAVVGYATRRRVRRR